MNSASATIANILNATAEPLIEGPRTTLRNLASLIIGDNYAKIDLRFAHKIRK